MSSYFGQADPFQDQPSIFQPPPVTPNDRSHGNLQHDRPIIYKSSSRDSFANSGRKRARAESRKIEDGIHDYHNTVGDWSNVEASRMSFGTASPAPLANSRYRIAGGMDTPTQESANQFDRLGNASESDFRRCWTSSRHDDWRQTVVVGALERERNGRKRARTSSVSHVAEQESWGQYFYSIVGGLAGRVLSFCKGGAFQGFTAGGGQGYAMTATAPRRLDPGQSPDSRYQSYSTRSRGVPGQYPSDQYASDSSEETDPRPSKRQQTTTSGDWVMVDPPLSSRPPNSSTNYPQSDSPSQRPASRASFRPTQPSNRAKASSVRLSATSHTGSPQQTYHKRAASFATARSPNHTPNRSVTSPASKAHTSPASKPHASPAHPCQAHPTQTSPAHPSLHKDLSRYSAKRQREVRQSDASMGRLNDQLQAMIRQGQRALASSVEVDVEGGDKDEGDGGWRDGYGDGYGRGRESGKWEGAKWVDESVDGGLVEGWEGDDDGADHRGSFRGR